MFRMFNLLDDDALARLRAIAKDAEWIDGRSTNPTNTGKKNLQLAEGEMREEAGQIVANALRSNGQFCDYALPAIILAAQLSRTGEGMGYAPHADNAMLVSSTGMMRNDIAVTVFLSDPADYEGGVLTIFQGDVMSKFKLPAGQAVAYPATMLHEVEPVTKGERLVAFTFVQSQMAGAAERQLVIELGIILRVERERLSPEGHARLLVIQQNLVRRWSDKP